VIFASLGIFTPSQFRLAIPTDTYNLDSFNIVFLRAIIPRPLLLLFGLFTYFYSRCANREYLLFCIASVLLHGDENSSKSLTVLATASFDRFLELL
jgi:hypothetical protein